MNNTAKAMEPRRQLHIGRIAVAILLVLLAIPAQCARAGGLLEVNAGRLAASISDERQRVLELGLADLEPEQALQVIWDSFSDEEKEYMLRVKRGPGYWRDFQPDTGNELLWIYMHNYLRMSFPQEIHQAEVSTGRPLDWHVLEQDPEGLGGLMLSGNFDGDAADELVFQSQEMPCMRGDCALRVYEFDGTVREVPGFGWLEVNGCWDYDGDGIDDLRVVDWKQAMASGGIVPARTRFQSLSGELLGYLEGRQPYRDYALGDIDGDGNRELLLWDVNYQEGSVHAYGPGGEEVLQVEVGPMGLNGFCADINMDGVDELVLSYTLDEQAVEYNCTAVMFAGEPDEVREVLGRKFLAWPGCRLDADGDGVEDIQSWQELYLGGREEPVELEVPPDMERFFLENRWMPNVMPVRYGGEPAITGRVIRREGGQYSDGVAIWGIDGRLLYMEYFGEMLESVAVSSDGRTIAVKTGSRLMLAALEED